MLHTYPQGIDAVHLYSELLSLPEIPVYLLLVQNHFSRSSPRSTTAFRHVILVLSKTKTPLYFNHAKNCMLIFGVLNSTLSSAESKPDHFRHVMDFPKFFHNPRLPRCTNIRRQHHRKIKMLGSCPLGAALARLESARYYKRRYEFCLQ